MATSRRGEAPRRANPDHSLAKIADKTGRTERELAGFVAAIERKGQAVLVGPPGAGKTFLAEELARHLTGGGDGIVRVLGMHASWTYQDFVQGYRPERRADGSVYYPLERGRFVQFCDDARVREGRSVLVLDELHRCDAPRILGELLYLLEKRGEPIPLALGEVPFDVPAKVRVLATASSTHDGLLLPDAVLRRRFAFLPIAPSRELLRKFHARTGYRVDGLLAAMDRVDATVDDSRFALGVTFFLRERLETELEGIWRFEVEPLLEAVLRTRTEKMPLLRWDAVRTLLA